MNDDHVTVLRRLYAAFNRRDIDGVAQVLDQGIQVDETEDLAYAAALLRVLGPRFMILSAGYRGIDEVAGLSKPTLEGLCAFIAEQLRPTLPALASVKVLRAPGDSFRLVLD